MLNHAPCDAEAAFQMSVPSIVPKAGHTVSLSPPTHETSLLCVIRCGGPLHHLGQLGAPLGGPVLWFHLSLLGEGPWPLVMDCPLGSTSLKPFISRDFVSPPSPCWPNSPTPIRRGVEGGMATACLGHDLVIEGGN